MPIPPRRLASPFARLLAPLFLPLLLSACASSSPVSQTAPESPSPAYWAFFGSSPARPEAQGIYRCRFDPATGQLTGRTLAIAAPDPNFLAFSPDHRFLYASTNTLSHGQSHGAVTAFALDPATGNLRKLDAAPSAGRRAVHVSVDPTGQAVLVANYVGNTVAALPVENDGAVEPPTPAGIQTCTGSGPNRARQQSPHLHSIYTSPRGHFAYACDLGADRIRIFAFDPHAHTLRPVAQVATPPGAGPRHLAFSRNGERAYLITEMGSTLIVYHLDPQNGTLSQLQTLSSLPPRFPPAQRARQTGAEVQVDPSGRFLYASNRGPHSSIDLFAIDPATGTLAFLADQPSGGKTPRHFTLDPTGRFLFVGNQNSDRVSLFRIDPRSGRLTPAGTALPIPSPMCTAFAPVAPSR